MIFEDLELRLESKINLIALALCALSSFFWMVLLAKRYYFYYLKYYWDMASFGHTLWKLLHGSFYSSLIGAYFPAIHCTFLSFLFLPFYWLVPDPIILEYFKVAAFFSGSYVFFLILKKRLPPLIALFAMIAYTVAPANIAMLRFDFNYEPLSIPLIFLIFKGLDDRNYNLYIICCFLLALLKEQMPLVILMFGILAFFVVKKDRLKWAWAPFLMGLTIFILDVFIITPYCRKDCPVTQNYFWHEYAQFGKTPINILCFLLTHPFQVLGQLFSPLNIKWYNGLFGIWGALAFFNPPILLVAAPLFIKNLLSSNPWEHMVTAEYYAATFTPFIFLATWNTLNQIQNKWRHQIHCLVLILMFLHAFSYWTEWKSLLDTPIKEKAIIYQWMIQKIPPQAVVTSYSYALPFLANRNEFHDASLIFTGKYYISGKNFGPLDHIDYILMSYSNTARSLDPHTRKAFIPLISKFNFDNHWTLLDSIEDIVLFGRNTSLQNPPKRLLETGMRPFIQNTGKPIMIDHLLSLEKIEYPKIFPQRFRIFPLTMYWKCFHQTNIAYIMDISLVSNGSTYYRKQRPIGSNIYPTDFWKKNEYIKENYFYLFPHLQPGKYFIKINFYNPIKKTSLGKIDSSFSVQ